MIAPMSCHMNGIEYRSIEQKILTIDRQYDSYKLSVAVARCRKERTNMIRFTT